MKKYLIIPLSVVTVFLFSCDLFDSGSDTPKDTPSLVTASQTGRIPDTLAYGDTASFSLTIRDEEKRSVSITVSGQPGYAVMSTSENNGEAAVALKLFGIRTVRDAAYSIIIKAEGSGNGDTLTVVHNVFIKGPDGFSLVSEFLSGNLPDTLGDGDSVSISLEIRDRDGDPVTAAVSGLPGTTGVRISESGDAVSVSFTLRSGDLADDSLYTISVHASGSGSGDTLTLVYRVLALGPDVFSLKSRAVTAVETLPDTLYYGQSGIFILKIFDEDGDPANATVGGLPASAYTRSASGDTAVITLFYTGDSLQHDSLYRVRIRAEGSAGAYASGEDTLTIAYDMLVLDSTRLGGLRKLAPGMWWEELQTDRITRVLDSAELPARITVDTVTHHKYTQVAGMLELNGAAYYRLNTWDTLAGLDSIEYNGFLIQHTDSSVVMLSPFFNPFDSLVLDTLHNRIFSLPLTVGESWVSLDFSSELSFRFFQVWPVRFAIDYSGTSSVKRNSRFTLGDESLECFELDIELTARGSLVADSLFSVWGDTLAEAGDTLFLSASETNEALCVNPTVTIPLRSDKTVFARDTSYIENTILHTTTVSHTELKVLYDPRFDVVRGRD